VPFCIELTYPVSLDIGGVEAALGQRPGGNSRIFSQECVCVREVFNGGFFWFCCDGRFMLIRGGAYCSGMIYRTISLDPLPMIP